MKRTVRRLAWVGVALCVVALAFGVTVTLLERLPGVTEANVRRIRPGMPRAEVEALLGRGPDMEGGGWHPYLAWVADSGSAAVTLSTNGRVMWGALASYRPAVGEAHPGHAVISRRTSDPAREVEMRITTDLAPAFPERYPRFHHPSRSPSRSLR